jgi:ubiquinone/menaquinone biosynthesis C-methylase UbiE
MKENKFNYNEIGKGYYDEILLSDGAQSKWHELKFKRIYSLIKKESPKKILDVACGPGTFISKLPDGMECFGVDIAEKQINYAKEKYGKKGVFFYKCDDAKYPLNNDAFDIVTSIEFIEHVSIDSCKKNFLEMKRCLKDGGKVIITTPNYNSMWPILEYIVSHITKENYLEQHITHYSKKKLIEIMQDSGFVNVKVESYIFLSPFFIYFGNKISNWIFDKENKYLKRWGNLLIATGEVRNEKL